MKSKHADQLKNNSFANRTRKNGGVLPVAVLLILMAILSAGWTHSARASGVVTAPVKKTVLVLFPQQIDQPVNVIAAQAIREEFGGAADLNLDVYYEYMDLNRFPDPAYQQKMFDLYTAKYQSKPVDLVIVISEFMLNLWLAQRAKILPNTPIVFFDITTERLAALKLPSDVTGVSGVEDYTKSVRWVLDKQPTINEIVIVHGVGQADQEYIQPVQTLQQKMQGQIKFTDLSSLPLPEIKQRVAQLPKSAVVLYMLMFEDIDGNRYRPIDALRELTAVSTVPVISGYDHFIGTGSIGGYLYSIDHQARDAAQISLRILRGAAANAIPVVKDQSNRFIFDHLALQKFNIPLSALPPDSIIKNRQYSVWELYQPQIITVMVAFAVLLLLLTFLIIITQRLNMARLALARSNADLESRVEQRTSALSQTNHDLELEITEHNQVEAALRDSESRFRGMFEQAGVGVAQIETATGNFVRINQAYCDIVGYSRTEMEKMDFQTITHPDDLNIDLANMELLKSGEISEFTIEKRYYAKSGDISWVNLTVSPMWAKGETPSYHIAIVHDITKRKQVEEALKEIKERYEMALSAGNQGAWLVDWQKKSNIVDERWAAMLGYTLDEVEQSLAFWDSQVHPDDLKKLYSAFERHERGEIPMIEVEVRARTKSGEWKWISDRAQILKRAPDGAPWIMAGIHTDITERKQVEEALSRTTELLEHTGDLAKIGGWEVDLSTMKLTWTLQTFRIAEIDPPMEPALEEGINLFAPEARPTIAAAVQAAIDTGTPYDLELPLITAKGRHLWVRTQGYATLLDGKAVRLFGTFQDITERKHAEEALQNKETQIRILSDNLPNGYMYQVDFGLHGEMRHFNYISAGIEKLHGITVEQVLDDPMALYGQMLEEDRAAATEKEAAAFASMSVFHVEARHRTISGQIRWMLLTSTPRKLSNQHIVWDGIALDITKRKQAEEALHNSERRLNNILQTMAEGVVMIDLTGQIVFANSTSETILGIRRDKITEKYYSSREWQQTYADGSPIPPEGLPLAIALTEKRFVEELEHTIVALDGEKKWISVNAAPLFDEKNELQGAIAGFRDITARKQAESALRDSLAEKEILIKEVHHRVKNNLASITGLISLQQSQLTDPVVTAQFNELSGRIQSMALIHELLYQSKTLSQINLQDYLTTLTARLRRTYDPSGKIRLSVAAAGAELDLDHATPCGLIVNELITNAFKYAFPNGKPRPGQEACEIALTATQDGSACIVTVRDNGVGLPANFDWKASESLGMQLVMLLGQRQLKGQVEWDGTAGTAFSLRFVPQLDKGK